MATLADAGERERPSIPQWTHTLEPKNGLAKVNGKRLIVCPPQAQRVVTLVFDIRDADRVALVHESSSEYCCHRAHNSGRLRAAQASASSVSRGSASPAQRASVSIKNTAAFVASRNHVEVWRRMVTEVHLDSTAIESPNRSMVHYSAEHALVQPVHYYAQTWPAASDRQPALRVARCLPL